MGTKRSSAGLPVKRASSGVIGLLTVGVMCVSACSDTPASAQSHQALPAPAPGKVLWQLYTDVDYRGPVQRGAVDLTDESVYLAAKATLYRVEAGEVEIVGEQPSTEAQLALAPGGKTYAWLIPEAGRQGLFSVRLMDVSGEWLADLVLEEFPYGFSALYLGLEGRLIVTASPLDDWAGLRGRFRYTFWDRGGEVLNRIELPSRQIGSLDPTGRSILLLGDKAATAFSSSGKQLWQLEGEFRKAAIADGGALAVLNPASRELIDQAFIYGGSGEPAIAKASTPIHDLIMIPDGSLALVVGDQGRYSYLDTRTAEIREGPPLPIDGSFRVSDAEFVDYETVALSVLHRVGKPPEHRWPKGSIIVIDRDGAVDFQMEFPIREPIASVPAIDVVFEQRLFVGFTEDTTVLVDMRQ